MKTIIHLHIPLLGLQADFPHRPTWEQSYQAGRDFLLESVSQARTIFIVKAITSLLREIL